MAALLISVVSPDSIKAEGRGLPKKKKRHHLLLTMTRIRKKRRPLNKRKRRKWRMETGARSEMWKVKIHRMTMGMKPFNNITRIKREDNPRFKRLRLL